MSSTIDKIKSGKMRVKFGPDLEVKSFTGTPEPSQSASQAVDILIQPYSLAGRFGWNNLRANASWSYYKSISVIRDSCDLGADNFATVPFAIYDNQTKEHIREFDISIPATQILNILKAPNQEISGTEFKKSHYLAYYVTGDTFFLSTSMDKDGEPLELYNINPKNVSETLNANELVSMYHINTGIYRGNYVRTETEDDRIVYINSRDESHQLWVMKSFNPDSYSGRGLSKLSSVYFEIEQHSGVQKHNNSLLRNGVRPSGAMIPNTIDGETCGAWTDTQIQQMKSQVQSFYGGYNNAGNVMVLDGIKEFIELSVNNKDMEFNDLLKSVKRTIYNIFNIPLPLKNGENQTFDNFEEAKYMLFDLNIVPFAHCYADEINRFLMPRLDDTGRYEFVCDTDEIPILKARKMQRLLKFKDSVTKNEIRERLNLEEREDGDIYSIGGGKEPTGETDVGELSTKSIENLNKEEFTYALMDRGYTELEAEKKAVSIYGCNHIN